MSTQNNDDEKVYLVLIEHNMSVQCKDKELKILNKAWDGPTPKNRQKKRTSCMNNPISWEHIHRPHTCKN